MDGQQLPGPAAEAADEAAELLGLVAGDVALDADGMFRIVPAVARDRVLSTVDRQARHGHKSQARRLDGYKSHLSVDPDDELLRNVAVTPANSPDRDAPSESSSCSSRSPTRRMWPIHATLGRSGWPTAGHELTTVKAHVKALSERASYEPSTTKPTVGFKSPPGTSWLWTDRSGTERPIPTTPKAMARATSW